MQIYLNFLVLFFSSSVFAGGFVGSGGESFKDEKNPWFVKNTTEVRYCISIDSSSITIPVAQIPTLIQEAFEYWKTQLNISHAGTGFTSLATQKFIEQTSCTNDTDIEFKFGYGTLISEEVEFMVDPRKYIGFTIRKDYDETQMRGKGIVYISSDRGQHIYHSEHLITEAWSKPNLLKYALIHEIGHIMGIAHTGVGVMSETFLTQLLNKNGWTFYASRPTISFTQSLETAEICNPHLSDSFEPTFFGLNANDRCLRLQKTNSSQWVVLSASTSSDSFKEIGTLKATASQQTPFDAKPIIYIYLPDQQKVFTQGELGFSDFLVGAATQNQIYQGVFTRTDSLKPYPVQLNVSAESIYISGIIVNQIKPIFMHALPGLKGIVFP